MPTKNLKRRPSTDFPHVFVLAVHNFVHKHCESFATHPTPPSFGPHQSIIMKISGLAGSALMAASAVQGIKRDVKKARRAERQLRDNGKGKGKKKDGFTLQILHSSDNESNFVDANTLEEKVIFYAALQRGLEMLLDDKDAYTLHLTAGDHTIPGPFYQASVEVPYLGKPGLADILMFNAMGLDANGIGNHEFDGGIDE